MATRGKELSKANKQAIGAKLHRRLRSRSIALRETESQTETRLRQGRRRQRKGRSIRHRVTRELSQRKILIADDGSTADSTKACRFQLTAIAIPVSLTVLAYTMLRIEIAREIGLNPDGPIIYETEFVGMSGPAWPMFVYFLAPNTMLFVWLFVRTKR